MPANLVPVSAPVARNSPCTHVSRTGARWGCTESTDLGLEVCKLQPSAVELENVDRLGRVCLGVRGRRGLDVGRVLSLAVLAPPHKVGLALAATDVILLEAADRDHVGVCLAT
jgi:hypothetical protein